MNKSKWRIIGDGFNGFEVQKRTWYGAWRQVDNRGEIHLLAANSFYSLEEAKAFIEKINKVYYEQ